MSGAPVRVLAGCALVALAAAAGPAAALTDDFRSCLARARSEPANADCARAERDRQEKRLKAVWAAVRKAATRRDGKHVDLLEGSQKRWLAFRRQHCRFVASRAGGGYSQTYWGARCEARLIEQRVADLSVRLKAYRR
jgi:uncharacterized protein YecT (DUF1311 family)